MTRNPWNPERTPGGSSGGSAAAVAAGLVGVAQASDGAGSIRIPAACCGLFGLKPQRGRVSLMPDREHWFGLSVIGCVTRTVLDSALLLDVVAGAAPGDATVAPPPDRPFAEAARRRPASSNRGVGSSRCFRRPSPARSVARPGDGRAAALARSRGPCSRDPGYGAIGDVVIPRYLGGIREDAARMARPKRLERRTRGLARLGRLFSPAQDREDPGSRGPARGAHRQPVRRLRRPADRGDRAAADRGRALGGPRRGADAARDGAGLSVHRPLERDRAAGRGGSRGVRKRGPAAVGPARGPPERRGDADLACRSDRGRAPLGRPPTADTV